MKGSIELIFKTLGTNIAHFKLQGLIVLRVCLDRTYFAETEN